MGLGGSDPLVLSGLVVMLQHPRGAEKRQQGVGGAGAPSTAPGVSPFLKPLPLSARPSCSCRLCSRSSDSSDFLPSGRVWGRPCRGWAAGSSSCDPPTLLPEAEALLETPLLLQALRTPFLTFWVQGSLCSDLQGPDSPAGWALSAEETAVLPAGSARGAGGRGQLSEDLEHHIENLPRG